MDDAPAQDYMLLRHLLPRRLQPLLRGIRKRFQLRNMDLTYPYRTVYPYTQCSLDRQRSLVRLSEMIEEECVPGAIAECGVLDGGSAALMAWATRRSGRPIHLFDAWKGLPSTTEQDGAGSRKWTGQVVGSRRRVAAIMKKLEIERERLHFHEGWFHETFESAAASISSIALLHLDPDLYEPVRLCLATWYPKLSRGGFIQFDDYNAYVGCRRAVDEFLAANPSLSLQSFGTGEGRAYFLQKPGCEAPKPHRAPV